MAPDINSMPSSPRQDRGQPAHPPSTAGSGRTSQQLPPPPPAFSAPGHQPHVHRSPVMSANDLPGDPIRHPRPLTAAELYLECEKEQEAVVNRLTRELTALRAQSASVASNASHSSNSTSASLLPIDISDPNPTHQLVGATHPTPSRRHRSSSSLSTRSAANNPSTSVSATASGISNTSTQTQSGSTSNVPLGGISQASASRTAAASGTSNNISRPPSISASGASTPARQSFDIPRHVQPSAAGSYTLPHRPSLSRDVSYSSMAAHQGSPNPGAMPQSPTQHITSAHYVETAGFRSELETVKAENEALRQRVRALEQALRNRRRDSSTSDAPRPSRPRDNSGAAASPTISSPPPFSGAGGVAAWAADGGIGGVAPPRERSESQSTTASSRRGLPAEDDVRLGESAGSHGVGRGV